MENVAITAGPYQGTTHNVVFVATQHDSLYAIDSTTGTILWQDSFLAIDQTVPGSTVTPIPAADLASTDPTLPEVGIMSTPVIDPNTNTLYLVARTKEVYGGNSHYVMTLNAIDVGSGSENFGARRRSPTPSPSSMATTSATPTSAGRPSRVRVRQRQRRGDLQRPARAQRPALTLANGVVYIASASIGDYDPYHGWILGYSAPQPGDRTRRST